MWLTLTKIVVYGGNDFSSRRLEVAQNLMQHRRRWYVHRVDVDIGTYNFLNLTTYY
jgi:hypothetical protein